MYFTDVKPMPITNCLWSFVFYRSIIVVDYILERIRSRRILITSKYVVENKRYSYNELLSSALETYRSLLVHL